MKHALNIGMWLLVAFSAVSCQKERAASDGEREVRITFYDEGVPLDCYTVSEDGLAWS